MSFTNWQAVWDMGGYAAFVWPSFGIGLVMMVGGVVSPLIKAKRLRAALRKRLST